MYMVPLLAYSLSPLLAAPFKCYEMIVHELNISSFFFFFIVYRGNTLWCLDPGRKLVSMGSSLTN